MSTSTDASSTNGKEKVALEKLKEHTEIDSTVDLRVSETNLGVESKKQVNLSFDLNLVPGEKKVVDVASSSTEDPKRKKKKITIPCKYCPKKFSSFQAFGGHQNAHKKERALTKHNIPPGFYPFRDVSGFPNHLPFSHSRLEINMHSRTISKPWYPGQYFGSTSGLQVWPRIPSLANTSQSQPPASEGGQGFLLWPRIPSLANPREACPSPWPTADSAVARMTPEGVKLFGRNSGPKNQQSTDLTEEDLTLKL